MNRAGILKQIRRTILFLCAVFILEAVFPIKQMSAATNEFTVKGGVLVAYNGTGGKVIIPDTVKKIGADAFITSSITSVTIPDSVKEIGINAFMSCTRLREVKIPKSVTKIRTRAFWNCEKLEKVTVGNKDILIENEVFDRTKWQKNQKSEYVVLNGNLLAYKGKDKILTIPGNVKTICGGAFLQVKGLKEVTIPNSVKLIGREAFNQCMDLRTVNMADSVTEIGQYGFNQCRSLKNIELSKNLKSIGEAAFYDSGLTAISFPDSLKSIGESSFGECEALEEVNIPKSLTSMGDSAFWRTPWLANAKDEFFIINHTLLKYNGNKKNIVIPEGVTRILDEVFYKKNITSVTMPDSVTFIGSLAFASCDNLSSVRLSPAITTIGPSAFMNCSKLTWLVFPKYLKTIEKNAFRSAGLKKVVIPEGVTSIGEEAFAWCDSLNEFTLSSTVRELDSSTFFHSNIKKFKVAEGTKKLLVITDVTELILPDSITSFDESYYLGRRNYTYTFVCHKNSKAYKIAKQNNFKVKILK